MAAVRVYVPRTSMVSPRPNPRGVGMTTVANSRLIGRVHKSTKRHFAFTASNAKVR